jgi:hypothetical protein
MSAVLASPRPWFVWPFATLWSAVRLLALLALRLLGVGLGLGLMAVGVLLTATLIGAPIGVPLLVLGVFLLVRSVF